MGKIVTAAAYAAHRGVSKPAVFQAIREGRIKSVERDGRAWRIDQDEADREWAENTSTTRGAHNLRLGVGEVAHDVDGPNLAASRAKREAYEAELARLKYEQQAGILVDAEDVKKEAFKTARIIRDGLLNIPDRVAAELVGASDSFVIHRRLTEEIRKALETALGEEDAAA